MPGARSDDAEIYTDIRPHERQPLFIEPVVALISTSYGVISTVVTCKSKQVVLIMACRALGWVGEAVL